MKTTFMNGMFGPIQAGMCRLTIDGTTAIKTDNGYKSYKDGVLTNCDDFVFDIGDEMFFVIPTNDVKVGDIILAGGKPCYVTEVEPNKLTVINYQTGNIEQKLPERHVFMGNTYFYGKIVSMFGNVTAGGGENIFKYMMISQMMKGSGGSSGMGNMNPMAIAMLMGGGAGNIFSGLFPTVSAPAPVVTTADVDNVKEDK